jgi:hypothetical protein
METSSTLPFTAQNLRVWGRPAAAKVIESSVNARTGKNRWRSAAIVFGGRILLLCIDFVGEGIIAEARTTANPVVWRMKCTYLGT